MSLVRLSFVCLLCTALVCSTGYYYEISGGPVDDANTLFSCIRDDCASINGKFTLTSTYRVNSSGNIEKAWYVKTVPSVDKVVKNVYATLELEPVESDSTRSSLASGDRSQWRTKLWKHFEYKTTSTAIAVAASAYTLQEVPSLQVQRRTFDCFASSVGSSSATDYVDSLKMWLVYVTTVNTADSSNTIGSDNDGEVERCAQESSVRLRPPIVSDGDDVIQAAGQLYSWLHRWFICEIKYSLPSRINVSSGSVESGDTWMVAKHCLSTVIANLSEELVEVPSSFVSDTGVGSCHAQLVWPASWVLNHHLLLQFLIVSNRTANKAACASTVSCYRAQLHEMLALLRVRYASLLIVHELRFDRVVALLQKPPIALYCCNSLSGKIMDKVIGGAGSFASALDMERALLQFSLHMLHDPFSLSPSALSLREGSGRDDDVFVETSLTPMAAASMVRAVCGSVDALIPHTISQQFKRTVGAVGVSEVRSPPVSRLYATVRDVLIHSCQTPALIRIGQPLDTGRIGADASDRAHVTSLLMNFLSLGANDQSSLLVRNNLCTHLCHSVGADDLGSIGDSGFKWCRQCRYRTGIDRSDAKIARHQIFSVFTDFHPTQTNITDVLPPTLVVFLRDGGLMSLYLSAVLQLTSPTLISQPYSHYINSTVSDPSDQTQAQNKGVLAESKSGEIMEARRRPVVAESYDSCVHALESLVHLCKTLLPHTDSDSSGCEVSDPVTLINGRGLFLLAYQGISLAETYSPSTGINAHGVVDWKIPSLYYEILRLSIPSLAMHAATYRPHSLKEAHSYVSPAEPVSPSAVSADSKAAAVATTAVGLSPLPPLRVAFLSAFWFRHSVGKLLANVIIGLSKYNSTSPAHQNQQYHDRPLQVELVHITDKNAQTNDDLTARLKGVIAGSSISSNASLASSRVHDISPHRDLMSVVEQLQRLDFDIIVFGDVFMDSFTLHLAMYRLAPVQVAFWGHPYSSGFPSIDYFVSSSLYETSFYRHRHAISGYAAPSDRYSQFSEQLVLFDSLTFAFTASEPATTIAAGPNGSNSTDTPLVLIRYLLQHGYSIDYSPIQELHLHPPEPVDMTAEATDADVDTDTDTGPLFIGVLQSLMKMHPLFDQALAQILMEHPSVILVLQFNSKQALLFDQWRERLRTAVVAEFTLASVDAGRTNSRRASNMDVQSLLRRLVFIKQVPPAMYVQLVCLMDVNLDPFPFGGGVTLMDSCHCDVPFVTLPQQQTVHQLGVGIAQKLAYTDAATATSGAEHVSMVAHTVDEFVTRAVTLASASRARKVYARAFNLSAATDNPPWMKCQNNTYVSLLDQQTVSEWFAFLQRIA